MSLKYIRRPIPNPAQKENLTWMHGLGLPSRLDPRLTEKILPRVNLNSDELANMLLFSLLRDHS